MCKSSRHPSPGAPSSLRSDGSPPSASRGEGQSGASGSYAASLPNEPGPLRLPPHAPGLRIGLFGGTFNPPHQAHRAASLYAMKRLGLDRVWWLVTPGNPLKDTNGLPSLAQRIAAAERVANHPRIDVTDIEARLGTRYTIDTLRALRRRYGTVHFVWLMGADNLINFHRWQAWREIATLMPIAVVDRGLIGLDAFAARAPHALARWRLPESAARQLAGRHPPAWVVLHGLRLPTSSTALRHGGVT